MNENQTVTSYTDPLLGKKLPKTVTVTLTGPEVLLVRAAARTIRDSAPFNTQSAFDDIDSKIVKACGGA